MNVLKPKSTNVSRFFYVWLSLATLYTFSLGLKIIILFQAWDSLQEPLSLLMLGSLFDFTLSGFLALISGLILISLRKLPRLGWTLICLVNWAAFAFIFADFVFYQYAGAHFSKEQWTYFTLRDAFFIKATILGELSSWKLLLLLLPIAGTFIQKKYFRIALLSLNSPRTFRSFFTHLFILLLLTVSANTAANKLQAGLIAHKSGLGRNPIIFNIGQVCGSQGALAAKPSRSTIERFWREHQLGTQWSYSSEEYPWISQMIPPSSCPHPGKTKKNLIFILLESFSAISVSPLSPYFNNTTPEFKALTQEGALFTRAFMTAIPTAPALASSLCSVYENGNIMRTRADLNLRCGADILRGNGYSTAFLVDSALEFDNMGRFAGQNGYSHLIGDEEFKIPASQPKYAGQFGKHNDAELFQEGLGWINGRGQDRDPFFLTLVTTTNHDPFPQYDEKYSISQETVKVSGKRKKMHSTMKYVDHALGEFIREFKKSPSYSDTVIFIFADHPSLYSEAEPGFEGEQDIFRKTWIPLLILNPVGLEKGRSYNWITSHVDLMPTAMDMLGICDTRAFAGHSLVDVSIPPQERFAYIGATHLGETLWAEGDFGLEFQENVKTAVLYDISRFPKEVVPLSAKFDSVKTRYGEKIQTLLDVNRWVLDSNHLWSPVLDPFNNRGGRKTGSRAKSD